VGSLGEPQSGSLITFANNQTLALPVPGTTEGSAETHAAARVGSLAAKMPGILPMKVIKIGTSSQSRIAQACDRCRSKKIRCDGIRPTCTQCANVGFECRTSDKLSRRAFPRGYTESLEERVRALEAEIRDLKDLLDEKDEKIDMLSKMHGHHHHASQLHGRQQKQQQCRRSSAGSAGSANSPTSLRQSPEAIKEDVFRVQASPLLLGVENSDSYFMGSSSGRTFIGMGPNPPYSGGGARLTNLDKQSNSSASCRRTERHAPTSIRNHSFTSKAVHPWCRISQAQQR
jgi:hypothetical protein